LRSDNEFLSLNSTSFSITAKKDESRWAGADPPCDQTITIINGVTFSSSFASLDRYRFTILGAKFKKINGDFVLEGNNQIVNVDTNVHTIISQDFELIGNRAYYSDKVQGILSVFETGSSDGVLEELALLSSELPNTAEGDILPYTIIKLLRNQLPDPNITDNEDFIPDTPQYIRNYVKKEDDLFFASFGGKFLVVTPAVTDDPNTRQFPVYDDSYTISGTTYVLTDENHSFSTKITYLADQPDIRIRIRVHLQNPLYWKENKQYEF